MFPAVEEMNGIIHGQQNLEEGRRGKERSARCLAEQFKLGWSLTSMLNSSASSM